jgi:hypothetical protein
VCLPLGVEEALERGAQRRLQAPDGGDRMQRSANRGDASRSPGDKTSRRRASNRDAEDTDEDRIDRHR